MPSLKDVKAKIGGVQKTRQITKAMNMVAASRLRGAQLKMEAFRPYAKKFGEVLGSLAGRAGEDISPLLVSKKEIKNIHLVLCTSDRGLCGGFNANLIAAAEKFVAARAGDEVTVSFTNFGKKGRDWARKNKLERVSEHLGVIGGRFGFTVAAKCAQSLIHGFLSDRYDEVHVVFAEFVTMARQKAVVQQILPIPPLEADEAAGVIGEEGYLPEHICEPSAEALLSVLLTRNVSIQIYRALLETSTSEQAARMMAMDNATKACNDMLDALTLSYNKARQGAITKELMDIVGGAEALRG
ncbi:MAG: ATP synthase F1 subunit gamma [Deltaproteobacteria bacterium]|nr:ATP synthase F1 subunit gamma [Deltaproteobacteria bacterium]